MEWFRKLLDERLRILREDLALRLLGCPAEAHAWFQLQAKEIISMASLWGDDGRTAAQLDELWRQLGAGGTKTST